MAEVGHQGHALEGKSPTPGSMSLSQLPGAPWSVAPPSHILITMNTIMPCPLSETKVL